MQNLICLLFIFADQVFIDPTFSGIFVCGPLQSFVVNVCTLLFGRRPNRVSRSLVLIQSCNRHAIRANVNKLSKQAKSLRSCPLPIIPLSRAKETKKQKIIIITPDIRLTSQATQKSAAGYATTQHLSSLQYVPQLMHGKQIGNRKQTY